MNDVNAFFMYYFGGDFEEGDGLRGPKGESGSGGDEWWWLL